MSDHPPLDPHNPFGGKSNLNKDDPRTPERSSRPVGSFSPVPLVSAPLLTYEGGADELPRTTDNADDPNLLDGMPSEELKLLASAADPFATSPSNAIILMVLIPLVCIIISLGRLLIDPILGGAITIVYSNQDAIAGPCGRAPVSGERGQSDKIRDQKAHVQ